MYIEGDGLVKHKKGKWHTLKGNGLVKQKNDKWYISKRLNLWNIERVNDILEEDDKQCIVLYIERGWTCETEKL